MIACKWARRVIFSTVLTGVPAGPALAEGFYCPAAQHWHLPAPPFERFELNNGLRVVVVPTQRSATLATLLMVRVGARDEPAGETGYAHLFEHLMFKGTSSLSDGGYFSAIDSVGGRANADTDFDRTEFYSETPRGSLARVLYLEGDRLKHLALTRTKIRNQVQAVLEEKRLRVENVPYVPAVVQFMMQVWKDTPYNHSIIGSQSDLRAAKVAALQDFFTTYYRPENMLLAVVGPVTAARVRALGAKYLGGIARGKAPVRRPFAFQAQALRASIEDTRAPFPLYAFVWQASATQRRQRAALELLGDVLSGNDAARLPDILKNQLGLAHVVLGIPFHLHSVYLLGAGVVPRGFAGIAEIRKIVDREVARVREKTVTDAELCRAEKMRYRDLLTRFDSNLGMARSLAEGILYEDDALRDLHLLEAMFRVRPEDLRAAARKHLTQRRLELQVQPKWSIRAAKRVLEWLPKPVSEWLEGLAM